ncbi:LysR family transcriptional regulator [Chitinophaga silvisoli]|uniref:LysR family transcriptional regulator n=1 Tax=Chitinophaga silvisoli TaxID=2291814 RepID=UPI0018F243D5|nr:LysR family transcriptional regulator [Chitinophaga silvisoli]
MINLNDLKLFEAVAQYGSFTKAAEAMFTVQSNVTARIRNLEEEFGNTLFTRTSRKVELTPAGETFLTYSRQIGKLLDKAREALDPDGDVTGHLEIGCIETTMALSAPSIIKRFSALYPKIDLVFKSAMVNALIADVVEQRLDAAFVSGPVSVNGLKQVKLKEEQLVLIASSDVKQLNDILTMEQIRLIVFDQGCIFRARLEAWLSGKGIVQYQSTTLNSIEGIINFVEAGLGISILPKDVIDRYYSKRAIHYFPLNKELATMVTLLIYREDALMSQALKVFIEEHKVK